jgi:hypothetical protein
MSKSKKKPVIREAAPRDLSSVLKGAPPGAWVALSHDKKRVVGTGDSIKAASMEAQSRGEEHPVLIRTPLPGEGLAAGVR